jgi:(1->4)-alpha-D-glucan 1-alpha-D-glucosylmutase
LGQEAIAPGDEYQLYQTLVGAWPPDLDPNDAPAIEAFSKRMGRWQEKALREAKLGASWASPDPAYESAHQAFCEAALDPRRSGDFLADLARFVGKIGPAGALNGLVQLTLRLTIPGVPDTYQGTEFWDFSLVDPDNRRPIDFEARREALAAATDLADLAAAWRDGRIKQRVMQSLLRLRAAQSALFADGDYAPLDVEGKRRDHVLAFSRRAGGKTLIVAVPLHVASAVWGVAAVTPPAGWWEDTRIAAGDAPGPWTDILRGRTLPGGAVALSAMTDAPALVLFGSG